MGITGFFKIRFRGDDVGNGLRVKGGSGSEEPGQQKERKEVDQLPEKGQGQGKLDLSKASEAVYDHILDA